jgi:hypothetical protein
VVYGRAWRLFQVAGIEIYQVIGPPRRNVVQKFLGRIAMRVNEADAMPQRDVLDNLHNILLESRLRRICAVASFASLPSGHTVRSQDWASAVERLDFGRCGAVSQGKAPSQGGAFSVQMLGGGGLPTPNPLPDHLPKGRMQGAVFAEAPKTSELFRLSNVAHNRASSGLKLEYSVCVWASTFATTYQERVLLRLLGFVGQHLKTKHQAPMAGFLLVRGKLAIRDHVDGKIG